MPQSPIQRLGAPRDGMAGADAVARFVEAILSGDRAGATAIARVALAAGAAHLYEDVVRPAMQRVGDLWREDRVSIADEHVATEIAQTAIACLYPEYPWPPPRGPRALVACVQGERHAFGARMLADLLALDGWNTTFLGPDLPTHALCDAVATRQPTLVCLSVALEPQLAEARRALELVRERAPSVRTLIGGQAIAPRTDAPALGADAAAWTATEGVAIARQWKS